MISINIRSEVSSDRYNFIKWLAERDGVKLSEELEKIFKTELDKLIELHCEEYRADMKKVREALEVEEKSEPTYYISSGPRYNAYERTRAQVYATGNKWAIENFEATH